MNSIKTRALIVGGGVAGLTTARQLAASGFNCTVVSERFSPGITSNVAGALWEWPPAVCGYHVDETSLARSKQWCMTSYSVFQTLSARHVPGVYIRPVTFYFRNSVEGNEFHRNKMREIEEHVPGFVRGPHLIRRPEINQNIGLVDAYRHNAPMIDTDAYLRWLTDQCQKEGVQMCIRKIAGNLRMQERALLDEFKADIVINCSGLGAGPLANDEMYPLRGAVIRLKNDGRRFPVLREAHCVSHDNVTSENEIVFIIPRGESHILLGAIAEKDATDTGITFENHAPIRKMYQRCVEFLPGLISADLDELEPLRVGLRPFRPQNVRVEHEQGTRIIHNYGHGGAGVTLSWGCAEEVAQIATDLVENRISYTRREVARQHVNLSH